MRLSRQLKRLEDKLDIIIGLLIEIRDIEGSEDYYSDESSPDYEALNEFQTQAPVLPFLGDPDDSEEIRWIV